MPQLKYEQPFLPLPESPKPVPVAWVMITAIINGRLRVLAARKTKSNQLTFTGGKIKEGEPPIFLQNRLHRLS